MSDLLRILTQDEQHHRYVACCWWSKQHDNCVRLPVLRLATPHGHMDFCDEHIDYAIASLPREWLDGFKYQEPVAIPDTDDIPF